MVFKIQDLGRVLGWRTSGAEDSRKVTWTGVCPEKEEQKLSALWSNQFLSQKRGLPRDFRGRQRYPPLRYLFPKLPLYAGHPLYTLVLPKLLSAPESLYILFCI